MKTQSLSYFVLLLLLLHSFTGIAQRPDSVSISGQWHYIYPIEREVKTEPFYVPKKISSDELRTFRSWLKTRDPRAEGSHHRIRKALKKDRRHSKTEAKRRRKSYLSFRRRIRSVRRKFSNFFSILDGEHYAGSLYKDSMEMQVDIYVPLSEDIIPLAYDLPDGKYIQYYEPFAPMNKHRKIRRDKLQRPAYFFELKNNTLHGKAVLLSYYGDTIKSGAFDHGLRTGPWKYWKHTQADNATSHFHHRLLYYDTRFDLTFQAGKLNGLFVRYKNGVVVLKGTFKDNCPVGIWEERSTPDGILKPAPDEKKESAVIKVRFDRGLPGQLTAQDTFPTIRDPYYTLGFVTSDPGFDFSTAYNESFVLRLHWLDDVKNAHLNQEIQVERWIITPPSILDGYTSDERIYTGTRFKFATFAEAYYPNGQLIYRAERKPGKPYSEPTIYWDNGKVRDTIYRNEKGNYQREIYDRNGKLYKTDTYNKRAVFMYSYYPHRKTETILIAGFPTMNMGSGFLYKTAPDTISGTGFQLVEKAWSTGKRPLSEEFKNVQTRARISVDYNLYGTPFLRKTRRTEDSLTFHTVDLTMGDLQITAAATRKPNPKLVIENTVNRNFLPYRSVVDSFNMYLQWKGVKYNGAFTWMVTKDDYSIVEKNGLMIRYPIHPLSNKKQNGALKKLDADTNFRDPMLTLPVDADLQNELGAALNELLLRWMDDNGLQSFAGRTSHYINKVTGQLVNGLPDGEWFFYGGIGLVYQIHYTNGVADQIEIHDVAAKGTKKELREPACYYDDHTFLRPAKETPYIRRITHYENGLKNGAEISYSWNGDTIAYHRYVNGSITGPAIHKGLMFKSIAEFNKGRLNGTYSYARISFECKDLKTPAEKVASPVFRVGFLDDTLHGEALLYWKKEQLRSAASFEKGRMIGKYQHFGRSGEKKMEGEFSDSTGTLTYFQNGLPDYSLKSLPGSPIVVNDRFLDITTNAGYKMRDPNAVEMSLHGSEYAKVSYDNEIEVLSENVYFTKFFPNGNASRKGMLLREKKTGWWDFYDYDGNRLYAIDYKDSVVVLNDSVSLSSIGIYYDYNEKGALESKRYVIEQEEKYDCSHSDYYPVRQYVTFYDAPDSVDVTNGMVRNYFDNGVVQSEGRYLDGLPDGFWKVYSPDGKLNMVGRYVNGKRNGRWLIGDLSDKKYLGEICLDPTDAGAEKEIEYLQNDLDIQLLFYANGVLQTSNYYNWDRNAKKKPVSIGMPNF